MAQTGPPAPKTGSVTACLLGLGAPIRGLAYLVRHPSLIKLAVLPFVVNTVLFCLVLVLLGPRANGLVNSLLPGGGWSWYLLVVPAFLLAWLLVILLGALLVTVFGTLIAGPFNEMLSARVEALEGRLPPEAVLNWRQALGQMGASVLHELWKWGLYLLCLVVLAPLHLIPVVGSVSWTVVGSVLSFWFLGFEYLDYCFSRRRLSFADRRRFCAVHLKECLGLGMSVAATLVVPFVNLVTMPLSVVGATLLYLDLTPGEPKPGGPA
ncbi:MAG: EI24 domain-containing protein [Candidatus Riflebacteria bacterium]|nr:EI24 domain-containing protein [Candidatus Riflebacteria bacterium]